MNNAIIQALRRARQAYMTNVGEPTAQLVGGGVRGYLGLDAPEYADSRGMEAYRNAQALGNAPGVGAPAGAFKAMAAAPLVAKALRRAPRDEALEVARQNAVKMLGLPENNTAMDRAKALGFDIDAYHGTGADVPAFEKRFFKDDKKTYLYDIGVHASLAPDVANQYANLSQFGGRLAKDMSAGLKQGDPVVYPLKIRSGNVLDVTKQLPEDIERKILEKGDEFFNSRRRKAVELKHVYPQDLLQELQPKMGRKPLRSFVNNELGFDSVKYPLGAEGSVVVTDPSRIRSRFAAFDPARVNESDILGRADPRLLAALAAGTGGTAATVAALRDKKEDDKKKKKQD